MTRLEQARDRLAENYRQSLASKIETLNKAATALDDGESDAESAVRSISHQLRGSGASFGFPRITESAAVVEVVERSRLAAALAALIEVLKQELAGGKPTETTHILIVEDDTQLVDFLEHHLAAPGREFHRATTAKTARDQFTSLPLDLVILDLTLPDGDGRSLLASLQDRSQTVDIPVVVLSATGSPQTKTECVTLGAQQYLQKPLEPDLISAVVDGILQRDRRHAAEVRLDSLTGLANRAGFREGYERALKLSDRVDLPSALAILDLDCFKHINDSYGHNFGDEVLRRFGRLIADTLRQTDLSARWGGEEFVVLLQNSNEEASLVALRKLQDALRVERFELESGESPIVTFSGGLALVESGESLEDNLARADKRLYHAKSTGRDRVLATITEETKFTGRILFAEDDIDMAALVSATLAGEGFEVAHYSDGQAALSAALQSPHDMAILDKRMPGLDGFDLLEELRSHAAYRGVPILMLTAVGREDEIERAFELGADDYVQKPFKPRELLARTRRLLRRQTVSSN